jgi:hypothetical protein
MADFRRGVESRLGGPPRPGLTGRLSHYFDWTAPAIRLKFGKQRKVVLTPQTLGVAFRIERLTSHLSGLGIRIFGDGEARTAILWITKCDGPIRSCNLNLGSLVQQITIYRTLLKCFSPGWIGEMEHAAIFLSSEVSISLLSREQSWLSRPFCVYLRLF